MLIAKTSTCFFTKKIDNFIEVIFVQLIRSATVRKSIEKTETPWREKNCQIKRHPGVCHLEKTKITQYESLILYAALYGRAVPAS